MKEITVSELKLKLDSGNEVVILDVRENDEHAAGKISDLHIPMGEIAQRLSELEPYKNKELVVHCRSGKRSASVTQFLTSQGFSNVENLRGGITAWKNEIDSGVTVI